MAFILGTNGNNELRGDTDNNRNDIILGLSGEDIIFGGVGNDWIFGGNDVDTLVGEDGNDNLYGEAGVDFLYGDRGNDTLNGGEDNDWLEGREDDDSLDGGNGDDYMVGGTGNDTLFGGNGIDYMSGGFGNDTLNGGAGTDYLFGVGVEEGTGIGEIDSLTGSLGADIFLIDQNGVNYDDGNPNTAGNSDYVLITDFFPNFQQDVISLRGAATDYSIGTSPVTFGTAIFYTAGQTTPELVAIVRGESFSNFNTGFAFG
jgi:Ca2+-binding RTX toxin-like protein